MTNQQKIQEIEIRIRENFALEALAIELGENHLARNLELERRCLKIELQNWDKLEIDSRLARADALDARLTALGL